MHEPATMPDKNGCLLLPPNDEARLRHPVYATTKAGSVCAHATIAIAILAVNGVGRTAVSRKRP